MKIVLPDETTHTIRMIPLFYPTGDIVFTMRNEFTEAVHTLANTYEINNGYLSITFDFTEFIKRDRFQLTVTASEVETVNFIFESGDNFIFENGDNFIFEVGNGDDAISGVIYRGLIFATAQNTQDFKLSEGVYL